MKRTDGFTLVESLVALVIFLIAIAAFSSHAISLFKYQKINEERQKALAKAEYILNNLLAEGFSDDCLSVGNHSCTSNSDCCGGYGEDPAISWNVSYGPDNYTKKISVTVNFSYQDYAASVNLVSLRGDWEVSK
ncbi:type IV pilus modification PilV family protein [Thermodesulfatator atlanticus]|uniref:type IV pilus modification PilV family protein n=1 Tax=Thermodesulfatator atlanticus TaxID=501497 RepID=UPI0003B4E307|nr:type II secretion system protein [Thermodesulfatator atlanticus]